jgi:hypothetical protein
MIYRIITEDKGLDGFIAALVLRHFEGFSISKQVGYYKGKQEASLVVEIDTLGEDNPIAINALAIEIRDTLAQECILVQKLLSVSRLV